MTDSQAPSTTEARPSDKPSRMRLVIRAEILPDEPVQTTAPPRTRRIVLVAIAAIVVVTIIVTAISLLGSEPASVEGQERGSEPATAEPTGTAIPAIPPVDRGTEPAAPVQMAPAPAEPESLEESDSPPAAVHEALPNPSQGALQTIRGTVRVSVRVTIDAQGNVTTAVPEDAGPSRYFERLSVEAARKWTFAPADLAGQRTALLRFHFTREGVTVQMDE